MTRASWRSTCARPATRAWMVRFFSGGCGGTCTTHFGTYFGGDLDDLRGYGIVTHGQVSLFENRCVPLVSFSSNQQPVYFSDRTPRDGVSSVFQGYPYGLLQGQPPGKHTFWG